MATRGADYHQLRWNMQVQCVSLVLPNGRLTLFLFFIFTDQSKFIYHHGNLDKLSFPSFIIYSLIFILKHKKCANSYQNKHSQIFIVVYDDDLNHSTRKFINLTICCRIFDMEKMEHRLLYGDEEFLEKATNIKQHII